MPLTSDPFDVLASHNEWATLAVLERCEKLTHEQFHRSFPIGPGFDGGLHATLLHILQAMHRWADWLHNRPDRPCIEKRPAGEPADYRERTPAELRRMLAGVTTDLRAAARSGDPADTVTVRLGPSAYTFTRSAALLHALTHGHYHRAQCMNMLRHLNIPGLSDTLPELDVVDWQHEAEGAR